MTDVARMIQMAWAVRENAYAPYSKFQVGAVAESIDGRIYTGCNVENISFGLTNCAERVAISAGVADGAKGFVNVVVVADTRTPVSPCGACRQVMSEFKVKNVILSNREEVIEFSLEELLPRSATGILDRT